MNRMYLLLSMLLVSACTIGPIKTTYPDGKVEEGGWVSFGLLQTQEGYNTLYVNKGVGVDMGVPIPLTGGLGELKLSLGYLNSQRIFIDTDSVLILDVGIGVLDKGTDVTDTLLHGKEAVTGYKDYLETEPEISIGPEDEPEP